MRWFIILFFPLIVECDFEIQLTVVFVNLWSDKLFENVFCTVIIILFDVAIFNSNLGCCLNKLFASFKWWLVDRFHLSWILSESLPLNAEFSLIFKIYMHQTLRNFQRRLCNIFLILNLNWISCFIHLVIYMTYSMSLLILNLLIDFCLITFYL